MSSTRTGGDNAPTTPATDGADSPIALSVESVHAGYGSAQVLFDVSLRLAAGECVALLGSNGAGKTTLLRVVSGLIRPRAGTVRLGGRGLQRQSPERINAAGVSHVPEGRGLFAHLSVEENILLGGYRMRRNAAQERMSDLIDTFPQLGRRRTLAAGALSGGEQQMTTIVRALMARPRFLLLDEPTLGLAPAIRTQVLRTLRDVADSSVGVLIVEQSARHALEVCDRCYVMRSGRVVYDAGARDALADYDRLQEAYLGNVVTADPERPDS